MPICWLLLVVFVGTRTAPVLMQTESVKDPELLKEIKKRFKEDQDARQALIAFMAKHQIQGIVAAKLDGAVQTEFMKLNQKVVEIDKSDTAWMKDVVAKHGWPGKSLVGREGAASAWLLVQQADSFRRDAEAAAAQRDVPAMQKGFSVADSLLARR